MVKVGFAKVPISGCGNLRPGWGLRDELYGGVLYTAGEDGPAVLITLDHVEMHGPDIARVKQVLRERAQLPPERVVVVCSHTHSGMELDPARLGEALAGAVGAAVAAAAPAQVRHVHRDAGRRLCVNRRQPVNEELGVLTSVYLRSTAVDPKTGRVDVRGQAADFLRHGINPYAPKYCDQGVAPGAGPAEPSPEAARMLRELPEHLWLDGPVDPDVELVAFTNDQGQALGTLVRAACHATIFRGSLTKQHSADYPGVLTRLVEAATGAPAIFANGPCGNVKPANADHGEAEMERFGRALAEAALHALAAARPQPLRRFAYRRCEEEFAIAADMRNVKPEQANPEFERFLASAAGPFHPVEHKRLMEQAMRTWAAGYYGITETTARLPFSLFAWDDVVLATFPGEIFAEHSLALQRRFPDRKLVVATLADTDLPGYVPTREAFTQGGYEPCCATLPCGAGEKMVATVAALLGEFYARA